MARKVIGPTGGWRRRWLLLAALVGAIGAAVYTVPSVFAQSGYIDLTTAGASDTVGGAIWSQGETGAGTGNFDPFLQVQSNSDTEQGLNVCPDQLDTKGCPAGHTHALSIAAIPVVTINDVKYREFTLDANDTGKTDDYMSIDQFKLFSSDTATPGTYDPGTEEFSGSTLPKIYDLGSGNTVLMQTQLLSAGSGYSDITVDVPDSLFPPDCSYGSLSCDKYVILYSAMGGAGTLSEGSGCTVANPCNYNVSAGFEEWRTELAPVVNVAKTADTSETLTHHWSVQKLVSVDGGPYASSGSLDAFNGDTTHSIAWKINYTKDPTGPTASDQTVSGSVTVTNPTGGSGPITKSIPATINSLSDLLNGSIGITLSCPVSFPYTLAAGDSFTCTYTYTPSGSIADTGTNVATATLADTTETYSGSADYNFADATVTQVHNTAGLDDTFSGDGLPTTVSGSGTVNYTQTNQGCGTDRTITNTATLTPSDSGTPVTSSAHVDVTCESLSTTKNALPTFDRTYDWTVKKYVSLDGTPGSYQDASVSLTQFLGDSHTLYWRITPTRGPAIDSGYAVHGTIVVHNATDLNATGVAVSDSISPATGVTNLVVDCGSGATTVDVAAHSTAECSYSADLSDNSTRTNTATATLFGVDYTGHATIDFTGVTPTTTDATATVSDGNYTDEPVTSGTNLEYTTTAGCGDSRTITNTATLTEGSPPYETRTDSADAIINCVDLTVTKTATPHFTRTWTWNVNKGSADSALTLDIGQTYFEPYTVTYTATHADSAFYVDGDINVSSPVGAPTRTVNVSDVYAGNDATVDCNGATAGTGLPTSLAGGGTLNCTYSVGLDSATNGNNVATATLTNVPTGTTTFDSNTAGVTFGDPTTVTDETVNVTDTVPAGSYCTGTDTPVTGCTNALAGDGPPSGSITASPPDTFTKTFNYTRIIGPYSTGECGDHTIDNTADFTTTDTSTYGSSENLIDVTVPCPVGCTLTQGYWKTHSILGPAPFDDNWNNIPTDPYAPGTWGGSAEQTTFFYSGQTWYGVFWTPPKHGNAYYQLAHQYEAAVLNILDGADPSAVTSALDSALALFSDPANTPYSIGSLKGSDSLRQQFVYLAGILGSYNTGLIGPGHCTEDMTSSSSP